jgi:Fe-S cluster assembly protein SufB
MIFLHYNFNIKYFFKKYYKQGFNLNIESEIFPKGINLNIINIISKKKKEAEFIFNYRLNAFKIWNTMSFPFWHTLKINFIDFNKIKYYSIPKKNINDKILKKKILNLFKKLEVSIYEKKNLNIAMDVILDSISIITTFKKKLGKFGIIFCSLFDAIKKYPNLIQKFLGSVVNSKDNFFAALNSSIFSDGSFCYIPQNINCPLNLSTYFRMNDNLAGQFERTLIIAEKNSTLNYIEGCTALKVKEYQLHTAVVELIAFNNAKINYSTFQNWYSGNEKGVGGILNFVTKRGICFGKKSKISWTQIETGSSITWKYPSCILIGDNSKGEFFSIALTNNFQQADTGTKMIHLGKFSKSIINSKSITSGYSNNCYRGLVKITNNAIFSKNFSECDSLLIGNNSITYTYPFIDIKNESSIVEHEAKISQIKEEQLFYLKQRGISKKEAINLFLGSFCQKIIFKLPIEFIIEAEKLLNIKLEGVLG